MFCSQTAIFGEECSTYCIAQGDLEEARASGQEWGEADPRFDLSAIIPSKISEQWDALLGHVDEPIYFIPSKRKPAPTWWRLAHLLLIAADEACYGVGRHSSSAASPESHEGVSWVDLIVRIIEEKEILRAYKNISSPGSGKSNGIIPLRPSSPTIADKLNKDIACVQPKVKTASVGSTLRTLSHNLALLPPRGQLRAHWLRPPAHDLGRPTRAGLNILLIPYPYHIKPSSFEAVSNHHQKSDWSWFDLKQEWLPANSNDIDQFTDFIRHLIKNANNTDLVHAVIFPELSLKWDIFEKILEMIKEEFPTVELLIAGSSNNCNGETGNYVLSANIYDIRSENKREKVRAALVTSRAKHHRWRIDKFQAKTYQIQKSFKRGSLWWEKIPIPRREVHTNVFREGSIFTALICEDLARSEPCHEVVRSLGPSLIFVLLMDGPQKPERWAARYSTVLSDDPGSSVLTFTSRGLIESSNATRPTRQKDWSIALWKDNSGRAVPIKCHPRNQGTLVRLIAEESSEFTLDERLQKSVCTWKLPEKSRQTQIDISSSHPDLVDLIMNGFK